MHRRRLSGQSSVGLICGGRGQWLGGHHGECGAWAYDGGLGAEPVFRIHYGPACKIEWWGVGVVICLERGADCLHVVQLMPLPSQNLIISCLIQFQTGLPLWYQLTQVVSDKRSETKWKLGNREVHIRFESIHFVKKSATLQSELVYIQECWSNNFEETLCLSSSAVQCLPNRHTCKTDNYNLSNISGPI